MRLFLKHILLFAVLFFIIEKSAWFLLELAPDRQYDKRLENLINGKINKDLLVIGSSRGAGNILAGQIENQTGLTSYNLSYQGSNIEFHDFLLSILLKHNQPPKKILLNIDSPHAFFKEKSLEFNLNALVPFASNNYINDELIKRGQNSMLSKFFYLGRINVFSFGFKKRGQNAINPIDNYGSMPLLKNSSTKRTLLFDKNVINYSEVVESKEKIKAFERIQKKCIDHNIELICVFSPNFKSFNEKFMKRFNKIINTTNRIFIYDTLSPIYKDKNYFYDGAHLNIHGAEIFTSEISDFINANK